MNKLNELTESSFWEELNPDLSITPTPFANRSRDFEFDQADISQYKQQVIEEGYFQTTPAIR